MIVWYIRLKQNLQHAFPRAAISLLSRNYCNKILFLGLYRSDFHIRIRIRSSNLPVVSSGSRIQISTEGISRLLNFSNVTINDSVCDRRSTCCFCRYIFFPINKIFYFIIFWFKIVSFVLVGTDLILHLLRIRKFDIHTQFLD